MKKILLTLCLFNISFVFYGQTSETEKVITDVGSVGHDDFVYENGNVGIGVLRPQTKLHVKGSDTSYSQVIIEGGVGAAIQLESKDNITQRPVLSAADGVFSVQMWKNRSTWESTPFKILPNGDVGVGVSIPQAKLDVNGDLRVRGDLLLDSHLALGDKIVINSNNDAILSFNNTDATWQYIEYKENGIRKAWVGLNSGTDYVISKEVEGNILLNPNTDSNVGIGTTDPKDKLEVNGDVRIKEFLKADRGIQVGYDGSPFLDISTKNPTSGASTSVGVNLIGHSGRAKGVFISDDGLPGKWFAGEGYGYKGYGIGFDSSGNKAEYGENTKLYINETGNVGIGYVSENLGYKLNVKGGARFTGVLHADKAITIGSTVAIKENGYTERAVLNLESANDPNNTSGGSPRVAEINLKGYEGRAKGIFITDATKTQNNWFIGEGYNYEGIGIGYNSTSDKTEYAHNAKFVVNKNGVGIGTTNTKGYKLAVNGNIRAKEIKVETANWADFVFDKAYELPSLENVEKHIKENGHLENIPSAKKVLAEGINLGDMNVKLLQKIEELTLYTIDQDKKIKELERKTQKLLDLAEVLLQKQ